MDTAHPAMNSASEVVITLRSLDDGFIRIFQLNPARSFIEVGRASKTASKGLTAAIDNAWFESPIMSRSHAELTLVTTSAKQSLYLKDLQSTHGTFIEGAKLDPDLEYIVKSGDKITFGQKVTSGASTYPPKNFLIEYRWQQWSNPTPVSSPESRSKLPKPGFHVPYEYDDEESDDEVSREASVQIVMASTRALPLPGSRPSESSVELELPSSAKDPLPSDMFQAKYPVISEKIRAQNKAQAEERLCDVYDLTNTEDNEPPNHNTISKVTGSSQTNPIDLEGAPSHTTHEVISDSDNEPPEALPISQASLKAPSIPLAADPFRYYNAMVDPATPITAATRDSQEEAKKHVTNEAMVADSDAETSDVDCGYSTSEDDLGPISEVGSQSTNEHNWSEENFTEDDDVAASIPEPDNEKMLYHILAQSSANIPLVCTSSTEKPEVLVEDSQLRVHPEVRLDTTGALDNSQDVAMSTIQWSGPKSSGCTSGALDISQDVAVRTTQWKGPKSNLRAPSPSDAALARAPHTRATNATSSHKDRPETCNLATTTAEPIVVPESQLRDKVTRVCNDGLGRNSTHWTQMLQTSSPPYNSVSTDEYIEHMDQGLPLYNDGPFSGWSYMTAAQACNNSATNFIQPDHKVDMPVDIFGYRPVNSQSVPTNGIGHEDIVPVMEYRYTYGPTRESAPIDRLQQMEQVYYGTSSRLPISDIVNKDPSQQGVPVRSLKRKADEMAIVEPDEPLSREAQATFDAQSSQGSNLPDAQSREDFNTSDPGLDETILQPIQVQQESLTASKQVSKDEGPTKKKVKIAREGSTPIKAFMSGMLVGCISLAGACAAFIATIPDVVRDEALRDF
ncbi:hypothetical protein MMC13_003858 [Lambiella insularis]|nr:hypothetical protein [Lambiella insularis]